MSSVNRRAAILGAACAALTAGLGAAATTPAHGFVCNPIDECDHVDTPLPVDPTGDCWVSVHAAIDYYDFSGERCVVHLYTPEPPDDGGD